MSVNSPNSVEDGIVNFASPRESVLIGLKDMGKHVSPAHEEGVKLRFTTASDIGVETSLTKNTVAIAVLVPSMGTRLGFTVTLLLFTLNAGGVLKVIFGVCVKVIDFAIADKVTICGVVDVRLNVATPLEFVVT